MKLSPKEVYLLFTAISFVGSSSLLAPFEVSSVVRQLIVILSTPSLSATYGTFLLPSSSCCHAPQEVFQVLQSCPREINLQMEKHCHPPRCSLSSLISET